MKLLLALFRRPGPQRRRIIRRLLLGTAAALLLLAIALFISIRGRIVLASWPATPIFEDRVGLYLAEASHEENQRGYWTVPGPLPDRLVSSILAIEDKRFWSHRGIDWRSLPRALFHTLLGRGREGASTIAMQVARLQYPGRRTLWKKFCETVTARLLVARYGRLAVMRHYLKIMPQGNQIFGAAYAARRYFQKPLVDLSWAESALLAALVKAPGRMNLFSDSGFGRARARAHLILRLLHRQGRLSGEELEEQRSVLEGLVPPRPETRPFHSYHAILRLYTELQKWPPSQLQRPLRTSMDMELQRHLQEAASRAMGIYGRDGAGNIAIIVAQVKDGLVRGYLGSEAFFDVEAAGAINYACTPRSAGSTLKPFIFALALAQGKFSPASIIADLPFTVTHPSGDYAVTNFDDSYLGPLLYRRALANSRNIPAVSVLKTVGLEPAYGLFCRLRLADPAVKPSHYGLNLAVGGLYVTLENLVRAYGVLANGGHDFTLRWFEEESASESKKERSIIPDEVARQVTLFLSDPLSRLPSFSRKGELEFPFPVAIKTGTSQGFRDAWAVGFSTRYLVGVWIGRPDNAPMKHISGLDAAGIARLIFLHLQPREARGESEAPFPPPAGFSPVRLCPMSGQLAGDLCPEAVLEYLKPKDMPVTACQAHQRIAVDSRTGRRATPGTSRSRVRMKTCLVLGPEYAVWTNHRGLGIPPERKSDIRAASVSIAQPAAGSRYFIDPDTPPEYQTLPLKAVVIPQVARIDWYVDGQFLASTAYPYETRWPIEPGEHVIQARFPHALISSQAVRILVR